MDTSLIVSLVIAVVAIVPGVWALVNQANKDKNQAKLDMNAAAQSAAMNIIGPLQTEVARLQARVIELERALIEKTTEIGKLMEEGIDKDTQIRSLKYTMEGMQMRLDNFTIANEERKTNARRRKGENVTSSFEITDEEIKSDEEKKEEIRRNTTQAIENITNGSIIKNTAEGPAE